MVGHKRIKGSKVHVAVTPGSLPIVTGLGPGNEHESRKKAYSPSE